MHNDIGIDVLGGNLVDAARAVRGVCEDVYLLQPQSRSVFRLWRQGPQLLLQEPDDARRISEHGVRELQRDAAAAAPADLSRRSGDLVYVAQLIVGWAEDMALRWRGLGAGVLEQMLCRCGENRRCC